MSTSREGDVVLNWCMFNLKGYACLRAREAGRGKRLNGNDNVMPVGIEVGEKHVEVEYHGKEDDEWGVTVSAGCCV